MTDDLERRLHPFNPDDYMTQAECAREALAELSEVLSLRGIARRNAASKFLSDFETTLRSALSSADEIARLRAENEALREAVAAERERCAKVAEGEAHEHGRAAHAIAAAIRTGERG